MASNHDIERDLTKASVGYLSKDEYKRKREDLEDDKALAALKRMAGVAKPAAAAPAAEDALPEPASEDKKKKKKDKAKKAAASALSFGDELEEEAEAASPGAKVIGGMAAAREKEERQEAAMREVLQQQRKARSEPLTLAYTFRSEMTQRELPTAVLRGSVTVTRGASADEAAVAVRSDV